MIMNVSTINSTYFIDQSTTTKATDKQVVSQSTTTASTTDTFVRSSTGDTFTTYTADGSINTDTIDLGDSLDKKRRGSKLRPLM